MNTVAVRPRLDRRYDVIGSRVPQLIGVRDTKEEAVSLAEWAARRMAPCRLVVFGQDGATPVETRDVEGEARPARAASH